MGERIVMQDVTRQLQRLGRTSRWLLVIQRLMQGTAMLLGMALVLAWVDYMLRLPALVRVGAAALILSATLLWLVTRLKRALAFKPGLAELALRVERLYPALSGRLASAVEFDDVAGGQASSGDRRSPQTAAMMAHTIEQARPGLAHVSLGRVIDYSRTRKRLGVLLIAMVLFITAVGLFPLGARIAAARWLTPWQAVAWPKRTAIVSATQAKVWPLDMPLPLSAQVQKGYDPAMRVVAHYQVIQPGQPRPWEAPVLMNHQGQGRFERLIELPADLTRQEARDTDVRVAFWFEAGDDRTVIQELELVARPALAQLHAVIHPPAYAADFVSPQHVDLNSQTAPIATAKAWPGSTIELTARLNKPIPQAGMVFDADWRAPVQQIDPVTFSTTWLLRDSVDLNLQLIDEHGLSSLSTGRYRFEALEDKRPTVSITHPSADTSVLPSAIIRAQATARDDVGLDRLTLQATLPDAADEGSAAWPRTLAQQQDRQASLKVATTLDLQDWSLKPGQEIILTATAQDVYQVQGMTHEPVVSSPRRLRIIDLATFISQLRAELSALRQQAIRLEQTQQQLIDHPPAQAQATSGRQARLSSRLTSQAQLLDRLAQRSEDNRLQEPALTQIMRDAGDLVQQARQASAAAQQQLDHASTSEDQAQPDQQQVVRAMRQLAQLLDQSRDALTLELQLRQLQTQQAQLAQDVRALLPRTAGQDRQALPQALSQALDKLAQRQAQLEAQSRETIRQMRDTAQALAQQGTSDREQAIAQALAQASAIAQRQGLSQAMAQAASATGQNRLSQAGQQQAQALNTMQQMMRELDAQERHRQQRVRRRMQQLEEAIAQWLAQQKDLIDTLAQAQQITLLEPTQSAIRRGTMSARQLAQASSKTQSIAQVLTQAIDHQAQAVVALRNDVRQPARLAQGKAVTALEEALRQVRQMVEQDQQQQARQQRDELQAQYQKLAQQQQTLHQQTALLEAQSPATRKTRAQLVAVAAREQALQAEAQTLALEVDQTLVFTRLHRWIDQALKRAINPLRQGRADANVLQEQQQVAHWLTQMAQALKQDQSEDEFSSSSSGGGGGGGGAKPPVVPPLAELKLMRHMQQRMHDATRELHDAPEAQADRQRQLMQISTQQREMAQLGQAMIEKMQQQQPQPVTLPTQEALP